jgi:hypothetical protein
MSDSVDRAEAWLATMPTEAGFAIGRELYADDPEALEKLALFERAICAIRKQAEALAAAEAALALREGLSRTRGRH